jgi:ATP-dependent RNA helicase RhlE
MLSATLPDGVTALAHTLLRDAVRVDVREAKREVPRIEEKIVTVEPSRRIDELRALLRDPAATRVLVFVRSRTGAAQLAQTLSGERADVDALHGDLDQAARNRALERFRRGDVRVLVATDVAARGLDVESVTHVVNFDAPDKIDTYVHRIGRTARAGARGVAITFVAPDALAAFEALLKSRRR